MLVLQLILFINIIVKIINTSSSPNERNIISKRKENYRKVNENFEERALERTLKKLQTKDGQLILLICKGKCLKERADIAAWLNEYNKNNIKLQNLYKEKNESNQGVTTNISKATDLGFHFHYYQKSFPIAEIEKTVKKSSKQVVAFYVADSKVFQIQDKQFANKENFLQWIKSYEQPANIKQLKEEIELDEWLNSGCNGEVTRRSRQQTVLLAVHDIQVCVEPLLKNFGRSYINRPNFVALELRRPLSEENEFILQWRLKGIGEMCRILVLLRGNGYKKIPINILDSEFTQIVGNISQFKINQNCTIMDLPQTMQEILPQLNPIELEFFREERHLKSIEQNRQYLAVGTIGGVAVVALAMSIFWGLNGNDFVPKK